MSSGSTKPPKAPDPELMARLNNQANRVNQIGPYGSSTYSEDADGRATQTNEMSPELQQVYQRLLGMSGKEPTQATMYKPPEGFDQLTNAVGGRVGERYGMTKPQQQPMQKPMMSGNAMKVG